MTFYRVKIRVRRVGEPAPTAEERRKLHELIETHGGKDVSSDRPSAAFVVGVFGDCKKAKAFRDEARAAEAAAPMPPSAGSPAAS
jgi:hypothetical protein